MDKYIYIDDNGVSMPYRLYVPSDYCVDEKYPVIVFLHGAGERGNDNSAQLVHGIKNLFDTHSAVRNSIIIAPQCPTDKRWVECDWSAGKYDSEVTDAEQLTVVMNILKGVKENYSTDNDRIYAIGLSMGGYATWDLLTRYSDVFAAGVPICGGADINKADILKYLPIWTFHGTADDVVPFEGTKRIVEAIRIAGGKNIKFTTYNDCGHGIWNMACKEDGLIDWLLAQKISDRQDESALSILDKIKNTAPTVSDDGKNIVLPIIENENYAVELYGSSNESVIALDGSIYTPLEDMSVGVMYRVVNKANPDDSAVNHWQEAKITVKGQYSSENGDNIKPDVIPAIREWKGLNGYFSLNENSRIVIGDVSLAKVAEQIAFYFKKMLCADIQIADGEAQVGDIFLSFCDKKELGKEGYTTEIGDIVKVEAFDVTGVLYAGVTLTQILFGSSNKNTIPKGYIRDYPAYQHRGFMFDVARFYMPLDYLTEIAKYMAYYKHNEIHVHINDNGGEQGIAFRVESKKYPEINSGLKAGQCYSQDDYRNFQKEVAKYGIEVITEIDTPGHSSFAHFHNESWGGSIDVENPGCVAFVKSLFDEFLDGEAPVFIGSTVHVGCDEYTREKKNPNAAAEYFKLISEYVASKNKTVRMWNGLYAEGVNNGGLGTVSTDVVLGYYNDYAADYALSIQMNYPCINSNHRLLYIVPGVDQWGDDANWKTMEDIYDEYDVTVLCPELKLASSTPLLIGSMPCFWYDEMRGLSNFDIFNRYSKKLIMVNAEKSWCGENMRNCSSEQFSDRVLKLGVYAPDTNPSRYVETVGNAYAIYDFDNVSEDIVADKSGNDYNAVLHDASVIKDGENSVLSLDGKGYMSLPFDSVGYPYSVSFDIFIEKEISENAIMFSGKDGTLYLNYNDTGKIAYERKGHVFYFDYAVNTEEWQSILISCDSEFLSLYINNKEAAKGTYYENKDSEIMSSTFVLPTEQIGKGVIGKLRKFMITK